MTSRTRRWRGVSPSHPAGRRGSRAPNHRAPGRCRPAARPACRCTLLAPAGGGAPTRACCSCRCSARDRDRAPVRPRDHASHASRTARRIKDLFERVGILSPAGYNIAHTFDRTVVRHREASESAVARSGPPVRQPVPPLSTSLGALDRRARCAWWASARTRSGQRRPVPRRRRLGGRPRTCGPAGDRRPHEAGPAAGGRRVAAAPPRGARLRLTRRGRCGGRAGNGPAARCRSAWVASRAARRRTPARRQAVTVHAGRPCGRWRRAWLPTDPRVTMQRLEAAQSPATAVVRVGQQLLLPGPRPSIMGSRMSGTPGVGTRACSTVRAALTCVFTKSSETFAVALALARRQSYRHNI